MNELKIQERRVFINGHEITGVMAYALTDSVGECPMLNIKIRINPNMLSVDYPAHDFSDEGERK